MSIQTLNTLKNAQTIVIKIGSVLVTNETRESVRQNWLNALAEDVAKLSAQGKKILIISSGGIALGRKALGIAHDVAPSSIPLEHKQAASAVGQFHLFNGYYEAFKAQDMTVAQVLLTMSETENRRMHLNARETLSTLMDRGIVPVINENDTVSTGEIRFGDNDRLAARVGQMIGADAVVLLSTTDGLYSCDPSQDEKAEHIPVIETITQDHITMAGDAIAGLSTGGMKSKIEAAQAATRAGTALIVAKGMDEHALDALFAREDTRSTLFIAQDNPANARKGWIQGHVNPKGTAFVDEGALKALKDGKSLLPVGIKKLEGNFERGDALRILTLDGQEIGVGLSAYNTDDAQKIAGQNSSEIETLLGYSRGNALIHRNDLALKE